MTRWYAGGDPGLAGAIAWVSHDAREVHVVDVPLVEVKGKRHIALPVLAAIIKGMPRIEMMGIEKVHSMPKQGVASSFNFGDSFGQLKGVVACAEIPYELITPQAWQKVMFAGMQKGAKDIGRLKAMEIYPNAAQHLMRKKDHNRGDAICIAEFIRRRYEGIRKQGRKRL